LKNSHHIAPSQVVSHAVTPFQLAKHIVTNNHKELLEQFPGIPYNEKQNNELSSFLIRSLIAQQIIKVSTSFVAVAGMHHFERDVANLSLLDCQPGFYAAYFSESTGYQHLQTLDGSELTVVDVNNISLSDIQSIGNAVHKYGVKLCYLSYQHAEVYNRCLFKPDIDCFFGVVTADNQKLHMANKIERSPDDISSNEFYLNRLQDNTGAENHARALEVAIANAEQMQLEEQYMDKSPAYAALKNEMRKAENVGLKAQTIAEMEKQFRQYDDLKSRQPIAFAQIIFDVF